MNDVAQSIVGLIVFAGVCYAAYKYLYLPSKAKKEAGKGGGRPNDNSVPKQDSK